MFTVLKQREQQVVIIQVPVMNALEPGNMNGYLQRQKWAHKQTHLYLSTNQTTRFRTRITGGQLEIHSFHGP